MIHVYGQPWAQGSVYIVGDQESLRTLGRTLIKIADEEPDQSKALVQFETNDGKDFWLHVHREDDMKGFYLPHTEHFGPIDPRRVPYRCECKAPGAK